MHISRATKWGVMPHHIVFTLINPRLQQTALRRTLSKKQLQMSSVYMATGCHFARNCSLLSGFLDYFSIELTQQTTREKRGGFRSRKYRICNNGR